MPKPVEAPTCDRCGQAVLDRRGVGKSVLTLVSGPLRWQITEGRATLCVGCSDELRAWLRPEPRRA